MVNTNVFKGTMIDEDEDEKALQDGASDKKGNLIPKGVVSLERVYDLQNNFQGPRNIKTHNSTMMHEQINLGTIQDPNFINLSTCCMQQEGKAFFCLFK